MVPRKRKGKDMSVEYDDLRAYSIHDLAEAAGLSVPRCATLLSLWSMRPDYYVAGARGARAVYGSRHLAALLARRKTIGRPRKVASERHVKESTATE